MDLIKMTRPKKEDTDKMSRAIKTLTEQYLKEIQRPIAWILAEETLLRLMQFELTRLCILENLIEEEYIIHPNADWDTIRLNLTPREYNRKYEDITQEYLFSNYNN